MNGDNWRTLRAGRRDEVVLAVDYWPGRTGAGFAELAAELGGTPTVLESVPPPAGDRLGGAEGYLEGWSAGIDPAAVRLVMGNCAGAGFAVVLADRLADIGGLETPPPVVVFDPQLVDAEVVTGEFDRMAARLGGIPEVARPAPPGDLAAYVDDLAARYGGLVAAFAAVDPVFDDDFVDELTAHGRRYFSYLAAAAELNLTGVPPAVVAFASVASCSGCGLAARVVRVDVERGRLLACREVAVAVDDLMEVAT
jgi:hypothetical protein